MLLHSPRKVGITLLCAGIVLYAGCRYWLETRTLIALDMPISLSRGHITSADFPINLKSGYYIAIGVERDAAPKNVECLMWGCYDTPAILNVQWTLSSPKGTEASGSSNNSNGGSGNIGIVGRKVGNFVCAKRRYRLNADILNDASILNEGRPRLKVIADGSGYNQVHRAYEGLSLFSGLLIIVGATLVFKPYDTTVSTVC